MVGSVFKTDDENVIGWKNKLRTFQVVPCLVTDVPDSNFQNLGLDVGAVFFGDKVLGKCRNSPKGQSKQNK